MDIVFATNNIHKYQEIQQALPGTVVLKRLSDIGCYDDIPETGQTIEENSLLKAQFVSEKYQLNCFADDTGLEVEALNGAPGVYSARYAGPEAIAQNNIDKLLQNLKGETNRNARFKTVISLILNGEIHQFEGVVEGVITELMIGTGGFGYDPVFLPNGFSRTFGQMTMEEKNKISHRAIAVEKLGSFLHQFQL